MDKVKIKIGEFIKKGRKIKGFSQKDIGDLIDADQSFISRVEKDESDLNHHQFIVLVKSLELVDEIFYGREQHIENTVDYKIKQLQDDVSKLKASSLEARALIVSILKKIETIEQEKK